jgi:hypothetical protein
MVMTTVLRRGMPGMTGEGGSMARRLTGAGVLAGLLGGLAMIVVMILVTGAAGMGYATPLNVGMASFAFTIAPPVSMLPTLMPLMGVHLPASVAPQVMAAASGHVSPALISRLQPMLIGMHLPAATVTQVGALMSGHATNAQVAGLMSMLSPSARATVMSAMPVSAAHVLVGAVLHFAYSGFLGVAFAMVIAAAMMMRVPLMRTAGGVIAAGVIGGAVVYAVMRWGLLPSVSPLMANAAADRVLPRPPAVRPRRRRGPRGGVPPQRHDRRVCPGRPGVTTAHVRRHPVRAAGSRRPPASTQP